MPLSRIQPQFEPDPVPAPGAAPLVGEDDAAAEADREDEAPVGAVGGKQLALVRRLERGEDREVKGETIWECRCSWYRYHSLLCKSKGDISPGLAPPGLAGAVARGGLHGAIVAEPELVQQVYRPGGRGGQCARGPCRPDTGCYGNE